MLISSSRGHETHLYTGMRVRINASYSAYHNKEGRVVAVGGGGALINIEGAHYPLSFKLSELRAV